MLNRICYSIGIIFILIFTINLFATPFWRITHDTVFIHYVALLIDKFNYVPYKEIYDTAMPGALLFHIYIIGNLFGYTESGLQSFNFIFTIAFFLINFAYIKNQPILPRIITSSIFLLIYQSYGLEMSLQRDFIACFFILLSCVTMRDIKPIYLKYVLSGISIGIAFTIKPQFAIGLPIIYFFEDKQYNKTIDTNTVKKISTILFGFFIPIFISFLWLKENGGWSEFWYMQKNYIPEYLQLDANHQYIESRSISFLKNISNFLYKITYYRLSFFIFIFGSLIAYRHDKENKRFWTLNLFLGLAYSSTLIISGQYFPYHFMCFFLFAFFPFSSFLIKKLPERTKIFSCYSLAIFLINTIGHFPQETISWLKREKPFISKSGRVDRLTNALKQVHQKNETIQVFDWAEGGTVHALFNLEIPHKHKYITDHQFKHHLHTEFKKNLINDFLNDLKNDPPNIIIKSLSHKHPTGKFTTNDLPEAYIKFINTNYNIVVNDPDFIIYKERI